MEKDPSNKEVESLINCLDDLPLLLGKVKVETNNKSRYQSKGILFIAVNFLSLFLIL
jgi:hypothetical protein